jgi:hypothetical protein
MGSALHPQTILYLTYTDRPIKPKFGAPMRLKITTKGGFMLIDALRGRERPASAPVHSSSAASGGHQF